MEMFLRDGEGKGSPAAVMEGCSPVQDGLAVCIDGQGKGRGIVSGGCGNMGSDPAGIIVCLKPHIFYVGGGNLFQPYALPDTALGSVKDAAPRKRLLSPCLTEYYPPWEPPVSRLRAIRNGYFPPSEPPQHIVLPCIFDFIMELLIVISGELQMQHHQIIYKEVF